MGLKKNFLYNSVLTLSQFIFPIITFPYAARILGAEGIGITSFIESFSRYFLLFAVAGIPIHGMREIAKSKASKEIVERTFIEIYSIQFYLSIIATAVYFISLIFLKDFEKFKLLYLMGGFLIISNIFSLEWVFQGLEDFKFIALRTVFIRVLTIVLLFLLVKTHSDYSWYFFLLVFSSTVNGIVNLFYLRKYIKLKLTASYLRLKVHLKPIALTGGYLFAISIYTLLTTILLGFFSSDQAVGYYTAATRFNRLGLVIFSALSTVMIPRLSSIAVGGNEESYKNLINKSVSFLMTFGFPISITIFLLAPELINIFAGQGYKASVICVQIMSPIVLITGMGQIFGPQILIPFSKDKQNIIAVSLGAGVSLLANIILIPFLNEVGASISTLAVDLIVVCTTFVYASRLINIHIEFKELFFRIISLAPFYFISIISRKLSSNDFIIVTSYAVFGSIYFLIIEVLVFKNSFLKNFGLIKDKSK